MDLSDVQRASYISKLEAKNEKLKEYVDNIDKLIEEQNKEIKRLKRENENLIRELYMLLINKENKDE